MSKRILIVDDEPIVAELLSDLLKTQGWESDCAKDCAEALNCVHNTIYDAAIIDFHLPDGTGLQLHRDIRQRDDELAEHCVFISGLEQSTDNLAYYENYGGFLSKPFELQQVIQALSRVLDSQ